MKKQIFILVFLVVATFASVSKSYGQCDDALHPIAGKIYPYTIKVDPTGGKFEWYVVTGADLISATAAKADATYITGGSGYNDPNSTSATVNITWSSKAVHDALLATGATKFYLVVHYTTTCSENLKPYRITPINMFQIFVTNITSSGATYADICRSAITAATVDAADKITYNYGSNALYLKVSAKYFTTSWTPTIDITALNASLTTASGYQSITSIEWAYTLSGATSFTGTSNFNLTTGVATANVPDQGTIGVTDGDDEFVYVKIIIADGKFEGGATDQNIHLNLSAVDAFANPDVDKDANCADITTDPDHVTQVLKVRPVLTSATPIISGTGAFLLP